LVKLKSFALEDERFGVEINMQKEEVSLLYNLAFKRASKLLINNGFFFVKIKSIPFPLVVSNIYTQNTIPKWHKDGVIIHVIVA
jgi:hypothetical protein